MQTDCVTMLDIAKVVGVAKMTVSRALRNDPKVKKETRDKIKQVAEKMGYRFDPMLSALTSRRRQIHATHRGILAWMDNFPTRDRMFKTHAFQQYYLGASNLAEKLGYKLEIFWMNEEGMTSRRMNEILHTRNIHGILLPPQPRARGIMRLDWERFSIVTFGYTLARPQFHMISSHHFRSMVMLIRHLRSLGYRRLGLAISSQDIERMDRQWLAAFILEQQRLSQKNRIPPFIRWHGKDFNFQNFKSWFQKCQPQVVISIDDRVLEWIKALGKKVPREVGYVDPSLRNNETYVSGINQNAFRLGQEAVKLLISLLQRGERGIPAHPIFQMLMGTWIPGKTLRRVNV